MRRTKLIFLVLTLAVFTVKTAANESLFSDDFQNGNADNWKAGGDGDISLTTYRDNITLRMTKKALAATGVQVPGAGRISIGASFAADDLEGKDACLLEATLDGAKTWFEVLRVTDGQDDSVTLHTNAVTQTIDASVTRLFIRARVAGNAKNDTCWLDNVFVAWSPINDEQPEPIAQRTLTATFLNGNASLHAPVSSLEFAPTASSTESTQLFNANLIHSTDTAADGFTIITDTLNRAQNYSQTIKTLPAFNIHFIQSGRDLIPLERGVIKTNHPYWEWVVQPGAIWQEADDEGWSRAAVPFALQERAANCKHNGVLT